jgi:hypothetical protein
MIMVGWLVMRTLIIFEILYIYIYIYIYIYNIYIYIYIYIYNFFSKNTIILVWYPYDDNATH